MKFIKIATNQQVGYTIVLLLLVVITYSRVARGQAITLGEAVDKDSLTWTTGGDANWFGQTLVYFYDEDAAQSGNMSSGTNRTSWIQTTLTTVDPILLSFYWKVTSLSVVNALKFEIDGEEESKCMKYDNWELKGYSVSPGNHTLRWMYAPIIHSTGDAGFLDKVDFIQAPAIMVLSPNGDETWYHRNDYDIQWVSTDNVDPYVKIELYRAGSLSYTISTSTENDGFYNWFIPATLEPGGDYRIKISSTINDSVYDDSDSDFSIAGWFQSSFGGFLVLDGEDDYAETPDHVELDVGDEPNESFTIEAWTYFKSRFDGGIIYKPDAYELFADSYYDYGYVPPRLITCIGFNLWSTTGSICAGITHCQWPGYSRGWHHVALVYDKQAGEAKLYLDGQGLGVDDCATINNSDASLSLGKALFAGALKGAIDEVRISDVVRYTSDFDTPTAPFTYDENTRALWHFEEVDGATVFHDVCGVDNILVGHNGAHTEGSMACRDIFSSQLILLLLLND